MNNLQRIQFNIRNHNLEYFDINLTQNILDNLQLNLHTFTSKNLYHFTKLINFNSNNYQINHINS